MKDKCNLLQFPLLVEGRLNVDKAILENNIPLATAHCIHFYQYNRFLKQVINLIIKRKLVINMQILLILNTHLEITHKYITAYFTEVEDKPYLDHAVLHIFTMIPLYPVVPKK